MRSILPLRIFASLPGSRLRFFLSRCKFSTPTSTPLYSSIDRLYAQNTVFEIVRDESVKVYPHIHVQRECLAEPSMRRILLLRNLPSLPSFSQRLLIPMQIQYFLRAHLCTAVDSMRRKPCVRNCSREREGLYNGNVQQNPVCAASCVTKDVPISPRFPPTFFHRRANPAPYSAHFFMHSSPS